MTDQIDVEAIRPGDEMLVYVKASANPRDPLGVRVSPMDTVSTEAVSIVVFPEHIVSHIPRPVAVGDEVEIPGVLLPRSGHLLPGSGRLRRGRLESVIGEWGWVSFPDGSPPVTVKLAELRRVS